MTSTPIPAPRLARGAARAAWSALAVLVLAGPAAAQEAPEERGPRQERHRRHGHDPQAMAERLQRKLDLTDEQRTELRRLMERFRADHSDLIDEMRGLGQQLREHRHDLDVEDGREELEALRERLRKQRERLRPELDRLRAELDLLLTPEQRRQLEELRERGRERRREGRRGVEPEG